MQNEILKKQETPNIDFNLFSDEVTPNDIEKQDENQNPFEITRNPEKSKLVGSESQILIEG